MENNDVLIYKGKALKDLRGIKDMLMAAGDPFLAGVMNRAIECIENQPTAAEYVNTRVAKLEAELSAALDYIQTQKECAVCKHQPKEDNPECRAAMWDCADCDKTACKCWNCGPDAKNWEWRAPHGNDLVYN